MECEQTMSDHADIVREALNEFSLPGREFNPGALLALDALVAELAKAGDTRAVQDAESIRKVEAYDAARAEVKRNGHARAEYVLRAEAAEAELRKQEHEWSKALIAVEAERDRLREALGVIADYYESVYAPGDQAYQAAIIARAALGEDA